MDMNFLVILTTAILSGDLLRQLMSTQTNSMDMVAFVISATSTGPSVPCQLQLHKFPHSMGKEESAISAMPTHSNVPRQLQKHKFPHSMDKEEPVISTIATSQPAHA
jgi:hypothetical protein